MNGPPDHPNVVTHPPFIYLAGLLVGLGLDYPWPVAMISGPARYWVGGALIAVGAVLVADAFRRFVRAGTNIPTNRPATALVTGGVYRFSRNPIYVTMTMLYAGIAIAADSFWMLALLIPILAIMRYGVIAREEIYLEAKFGDDYRAFKASVRRWI